MHQTKRIILTVLLATAAACRGNAGPAPVDATNPNGLQVAPFGLDARPPNGSCHAPPALPAGNGQVRLQRVFSQLRLNVPMVLRQRPGDTSRWYVVERDGYISWFPARDNVTEADRRPLLDLRPQVDQDGEGGALGFAFHPQFATVGSFFVSYTTTGTGGAVPLVSRLSQFKTNNQGDSTLPGEDIVLSLDQPFNNHNGGDVAFGPDGYLYFGLGDGGSGNDPGNRAQNLNVLFGKMLRLDIDRPANGRRYGIPTDNPFAQGGGLPEIWASGLRNPWRWSFDRDTGQLWAGDVGQVGFEEIDIIVRGANYGWRIREGLQCNTATGDNCNTPGLTNPVFVYPRSQGQCIVGGYVYRGAAIPALTGAYIYGDCAVGNVWALRQDPTTKTYTSTLLAEANTQITSFAEGEDGEVYVLTPAAALRIVPAQAGPAVDFPQSLAATGCFAPGDATKPGSALIPYNVNAPLWSDGSDKRRWLMLPDGAKAHIEADGHITLPVGTVLFKEFSVAGQRVETRMLVRHSADTWAGYTYAWNDAQTDAALLSTSTTRALKGSTSWVYPSRGQCMQCHTPAAGFSLGLQVGQLNGSMDYPTGRRSNQLATLDHLALFDAPLGSPSALPALPDPAGSASVDSRARAYLHANCSHCHRPQGTGQGPADLRFGTSLANASICNVNPNEGDLGVAGAVLLKPGSPAQSLISLRMHTLREGRMPPLASRVEDTAGTALIDTWIRQLAGCP